MTQRGQYTRGSGLFLRGKRALFTLTLKPRTVPTRTFAWAGGVKYSSRARGSLAARSLRGPFGVNLRSEALRMA